MGRRLVTYDSVTITGSVIGLFSLLLNWFALKPNRIAAGEPLNLWEGVGWGLAVGILCLWFFCFALGLTGRVRTQAAILGIAANLILVSTFALAGVASSTLIEDQGPLARISLGGGFWVTIVAAYILVFAARQRLDSQRALRHLVSWVGLAIVGVILISGWLNDLAIIQEFTSRGERFRQELFQHILLFGGSVAIGTMLGVPLGIWATRSIRAERPIFFIANITQTIPSLALFGLLIAPLSALSLAFPILREFGIRGVGATPAMIALIIYSLLPIVLNTYVALRRLDAAVIDAGLGMGMSRRQVFRRIEVPLAAPLVVEGVRTASVQAVGNTTVAALIGAGGLGHFIFQGLGEAAPDLIIAGAIPIIILALVVDAAMRTLVRVVTPRGVMGGTK
ncbi:MAG: ABC transporter permease [Dehalococcoidia bacterium]